MKLEFAVSHALEEYLKDKTGPYAQYLPELYENDQKLAWELHAVLSKKNYTHTTEDDLVLKPISYLGDWSHKGNLRVKGSCVVEEDFYITGDLFVDGNLTCKCLHVNGFTVVTGHVNTEGSTIFEKDVYILGDLRSEKGYITVRGDLNVYGSLEAQLSIGIEGELKCSEAIVSCTDLSAGGRILVERSIDVKGQIICQDRISAGHRINAGRAIICKKIESPCIKTGLRVKQNLLAEQGYLKCEHKPDSHVYGAFVQSLS